MFRASQVVGMCITFMASQVVEPIVLRIWALDSFIPLIAALSNIFLQELCQPIRILNYLVDFVSTKLMIALISKYTTFKTILAHLWQKIMINNLMLHNYSKAKVKTLKNKDRMIRQRMRPWGNQVVSMEYMQLMKIFKVYWMLPLCWTAKIKQCYACIIAFHKTNGHRGPWEQTLHYMMANTFLMNAMSLSFRACQVM